MINLREKLPGLICKKFHIDDVRIHPDLSLLLESGGKYDEAEVTRFIRGLC
jgi:hypothetical protein